LRDRLPDLPSVRAIVGDRAYRGLAAIAERKHLALDIKAPPPGTSGFVPLWPLYRIEHAFAGAGALAPSLALLRGHRGERPGLARGGLGRLPRLARDRLIAAYPPAPDRGPRSLGGSVSGASGAARTRPSSPLADVEVRARRQPPPPLGSGSTPGEISATDARGPGPIASEGEIGSAARLRTYFRGRPLACNLTTVRRPS